MYLCTCVRKDTSIYTFGAQCMYVCVYTYECMYEQQLLLCHTFAKFCYNSRKHVVLMYYLTQINSIIGDPHAAPLARIWVICCSYYRIHATICRDLVYCIFSPLPVPLHAIMPSGTNAANKSFKADVIAPQGS